MKAKSKKLADTYLDLIHEFPLRPIRNDAEYDRAAVVLDRLVMKGEGRLNTGEADYFDALTVFIERYDDEHYPIDTSDLTGLDMLKYILEQSEMTQAELSKLLGVGPSAVSMILSGDRPITADHARALGKRFAVNPGLFL